MLTKCVQQINGFNTQPPEGGWVREVWPEHSVTRFNTQPPEGGWRVILRVLMIRLSFNTQPPEGGWEGKRNLLGFRRVSTHSRPKAAGEIPL